MFSGLAKLAADTIVEPLNMRIISFIIVFVFSLAILSSCIGAHTLKVEPPIVNMEVFEIPSQGKVVFINGEAEILKKERAVGYQEVVIGTILSEADILRMKRGCIAKIEFEDGSCILNEKQKKEVFITFEFVKTKRVQKNNNLGTTCHLSWTGKAGQDGEDRAAHDAGPRSL